MPCFNDAGVNAVPAPLLKTAKEYGFSDARIAALFTHGRGVHERMGSVSGHCVSSMESRRGLRGLIPAGRNLSPTRRTCIRHMRVNVKPLSGCEENHHSWRGPNRIGQGIEFDYCCVHAAFALKDDDYQTIMVNCNPETVSTDYDTSDRLYFEPLTFEDVMNIVEVEQPYGVIVQFGGQTPLNLAVPLAHAGVPILGTSPDSIDRAEDRERFKRLIAKLHLRQPANGTAHIRRGA